MGERFSIVKIPYRHELFLRGMPRELETRARGQLQHEMIFYARGWLSQAGK